VKALVQNGRSAVVSKEAKWIFLHTPALKNIWYISFAQNMSYAQIISFPQTFVINRPFFRPKTILLKSITVIFRIV